MTGRAKSTLKKRILVSFLDLFGFFALSTVLVVMFGLFSIEQFASLSFIVSFFIYYGVVPRILGGYTLFGYLFKLKIVSVTPESISLLKYILRASYAILTPFFTFFYTHIKSNENGQLFYDKAFKTNVILASETIGDYQMQGNDLKYTYYFAAEYSKYLLYTIVFMFIANIVIYYIL